MGERQYVYCLSNPSFKDEIVKIGWTKEYPTVSSLSNGQPTDYKLEFVIRTTEAIILEKKIQNHLNPYGFPGRREFFKISIDNLKKIIKDEFGLETD